MALPANVQKRVLDVLWGPLLFDWMVTWFAVGYGALIAFLGRDALHFRVLSSPAGEAFSQVATPFGLMIMAIGGCGLYGLSKLKKRVRMATSFLICGVYMWMITFYLGAVPLPWQGVFLFGFHAGMEALVYLRTASDPRHLWG